MRAWRSTVAFVLSAVVVINFVPDARACGSSYLEPVLVFKDSPDPHQTGGRIHPADTLPRNPWTEKLNSAEDN